MRIIAPTNQLSEVLKNIKEQVKVMGFYAGQWQSPSKALVVSAVNHIRNQGYAVEWGHQFDDFYLVKAKPIEK